MLSAQPSIPSDEHQPLLSSQQPDRPPNRSYDTNSTESINSVEEAKTGLHDVSSVLSEALILARNSVPMIFAYLLQYSLTLVTVIVVGHIDSTDLAATSIGIMTSNMTGISIYEGLAAALDTLCAQAYGAGRLDMVGVHVQRMVHLMALCSVPIIISWIFSSHWLGYFVSNDELASRAGRVMALLTIGNPGYFLFEAGRRFVQAQGLFDAPLYIMIAALPTNIFLNWLFVLHCGWGLNGAILALSATRALFPIYLVGYVMIVKPSSLRCWGGLESFAPRSWRRMIRLSIPGVFIVEAEVLMFQFLTVAPSYLSVNDTAAQSVMSTIAAVLAHVPLAIGIAVATRLGQHMGSGSLHTARVTMWTSLVFALFVGGIDGILLFALKEPMIKAFTNDSKVADVVRKTLPILILFQIPEHIFGTINGMLRGIGKQGRGASIEFVLFAAIGVPAGLGFCFGSSNMGLTGLWLGVMIGYIAIDLICGIYGLTTDLKKVALRVQGSE